MDIKDYTFKLIMAGNSNTHSMINAIIRATIQLRSNTKKEKVTFHQIHIFHTEESLNALFKTTDKWIEKWQEALSQYDIPITAIVHHVTKIEGENVKRFDDIVEQLRTIVNPLHNELYYVDISGGISSLKTILAIFAYVLDIEHVYSLEVSFSKDPETRKKQSGLFYKQIEAEGLDIKYTKLPPIKKFDEFGRSNYTEILRHRQIIDDITSSMKQLLPKHFNLEHLRSSLLSGIDSRLIAEVTGESYNYRNSVFSFSAGIEEVVNIILNITNNSSIEKETLGVKLGEIRKLCASKDKYFINEEVLESLTKLMSGIRNNIAHPNLEKEQSKELLATQSHLSGQLAITFIKFTINALLPFLEQDGRIIEIQGVDHKQEDNAIFYFGFDGDATGDYLETAFVMSGKDEEEVQMRSNILHKAIATLKKLIYKTTKDHKSIIFAEGDNILFKSKFDNTLLNEIQLAYKKETGLSSSIGYGKTLRDVMIALRLAKAKNGDSIVGISISGQC
ncbi:MAG: mCpol domain-containing protein [Nitrospirae bacterium]|nr:mCpol domain-containing protein [Nitrospirota bacterium]